MYSNYVGTVGWGYTASETLVSQESLGNIQKPTGNIECPSVSLQTWIFLVGYWTFNPLYPSHRRQSIPLQILKINLVHPYQVHSPIAEANQSPAVRQPNLHHYLAGFVDHVEQGRLASGRGPPHPQHTGRSKMDSACQERRKKSGPIIFSRARIGRRMGRKTLTVLGHN